MRVLAKTKDVGLGRIIFSFSGFPLQNANIKAMPVTTSSVLKWLRVLALFPSSFHWSTQSDYILKSHIIVSFTFGNSAKLDSHSLSFI